MRGIIRFSILGLSALAILIQLGVVSPPALAGSAVPRALVRIPQVAGLDRVTGQRIAVARPHKLLTAMRIRARTRHRARPSPVNWAKGAALSGRTAAGSVSNVTAAITGPTAAAGGLTAYTVGFTTSSTGAISGGGSVDVAPGQVNLDPLVYGSTYSVTDDTTGQTVASGNCVYACPVLPLASGAVVNAGDHLTVVYTGVDNPASGGSYTTQVSTSSDTTPATSNSYAVSAAGSASGVTASITGPTAAAGGLTVYTVGFTTSPTGKLDQSVGSFITVTPSGSSLDPLVYGSTYSVTDDTTGQTVASGNCVYHCPSLPLNSGAVVNPGDHLTVVYTGVDNPASGGSYTTQVSTSSDTATASSNSYAVSAAGSVSGVTASITGPTAAAGGLTVYTVGFTTSPTGKLDQSVGSFITVTPSGSSLDPLVYGSTYSVTDDTTGQTVSSGNCVYVCPQIPLASGVVINPGDHLTVVYTGVDNPTSAGSYTTQVSTSSDTAPANSNSYAVSAAGSVSNVTAAITGPSAEAGGQTNYTIGFTVSPTGKLLQSVGSFLTVTPAGVNLDPQVYGSGYTVTDDTTGQTIASGNCVYHCPGLPLNSGAVVNPGDHLTVVYTNVDNPATPGSYTTQVSTSSDTATASSDSYAVTAPSPNPGETTGGGVPGNNQTTCIGCPINTATGEFHQSFTDLQIPGRGMPVALTRTYSTNLAAQDSPFGFGWANSYHWFLTIAPATGEVTVNQADGAAVAYAPDGSGGFTGPPSDFATLTHDSSTRDYTYARDTGEQYVFNSSGELIKEIDRNGYVTTLAYTGGNLTTVTDPAGRKLTFTYGSNGKVATVTDPAKRTVTYSYDSAGDLTAVKDVRGGTWGFSYDTGHRMLTMTDPRSGVATLAYDTGGRVTSWTDPMKRATSYSYTDNGGGSQTTTETDARGDVTTWNYKNLELTSVIHGAGTPQAATTSYTYDPTTLGLASITDPNGHTTTKTYDARGNLLSATDPLGRTTSYTYNIFNEPLTVTDSLGVTTTNTYDTHGNLLTTATPIGTQTATTTYTYGDAAHPGDVTAMTNPDGNTWAYAYNKYGDRTSITDPLGHKSSYAYNVIGERTSETTPLGHKTSYTYDTFGNPKTVTNPLGDKASYAYDANLNLIKTTDANGNVTTNVYDADNELVKVTIKNPAGTVLSSRSQSYDKAGNVATQTNGRGQVTRYAYDLLNRETSVTNPLGRTTSYGYDPAGNRTSLTDPQGRVTSYGYDASNELTAIRYSDGVTPNVMYAYNAAGQRTSMTDGTGTTTYTYDALHRLTRNTQGDGESIAYGHDLAGNLTSITYPNGKTVTRAYDAAGHLTGVSDWLGNTTSFGYDADSNLTSETYPNGVAGTFTYDNAGRLAGTTDAHGATTLLSLAYTRDKAGQVTAENTTSYGYDGADRLTSATIGPSPLSYNQADQLTGLGSATLSYDSASELTSQASPAGTTTFGYDHQGNRTTATPPAGAAASYAYDQANRLTSITQGPATARYAYDGDGLRMAKTVAATTTRFAWDLADGFPLTVQAGTTSYVTGPGGLPIEQVDGTTVLYYAHDQLGSTRLLTDASGNPAATFSYDPYGAVAAHTGTVTTAFGFAGQYTDAESGLIYLRARYYDPGTRQFLSVDPFLRQTHQPYVYAADNPISRGDPAGLDACAGYTTDEGAQYLCQSTEQFCSYLDGPSAYANCFAVLGNTLANLQDAYNQLAASLVACQNASSDTQRQQIASTQQRYATAAVDLATIAKVITTIAIPEGGSHWKNPILQKACQITEVVGVSAAGVATFPLGMAGAVGTSVAGGGIGISEILDHGPCS